MSFKDSDDQALIRESVKRVCADFPDYQRDLLGEERQKSGPEPMGRHHFGVAGFQPAARA